MTTIDISLNLAETLKELVIKNDGSKPILQVRNESTFKLRIGVGIENEQLVVIIQDQS